MFIHDEIQEIIDAGKEINHTIEVLSIIKTGKEAIVYKALLDDEFVAMKVYKNRRKII